MHFFEVVCALCTCNMTWQELVIILGNILITISQKINIYFTLKNNIFKDSDFFFIHIELNHIYNSIKWNSLYI
jgi:hypothetical protein